MQLKPITAIIVLSLVVASLLVLGCIKNITSPAPTPTPTPAPTSNPNTMTTDHSAYFDKVWSRGGFIIEQSFKKSTNERGNLIYTGIIRNSSLSKSDNVTTVEELTDSQADAKLLYDTYKAQKESEGFAHRLDCVAGWTAKEQVTWTAEEREKFGIPYEEAWCGENGSQIFYVMYRYNPQIQSWDVTTELSL